MDNEMDAMNIETEQARQFFMDIIEEAVTKAVEQAVSPRFDEQKLRMDEQSRRMEEQNHKMEEQSRKMDQQNHKQIRNMEELNLKTNQLRIDMRIAISTSNPEPLRGTIKIPSLVSSFESATTVGGEIIE